MSHRLVAAVAVLCSCVGLRSAAAFSWQAMGPRGGSAHAIAVDADPTILYADGDDGVFRSADGGLRWTLVLPGDMLGVGADPTTSGRVYATRVRQSPCPFSCITITIDILRSTDAGDTWTVVHSESRNNAFPRRGWISALAVAVDPAAPQTIHAGGWARSVDGGATWSPVDGIPYGAWTVVVDPSAPGVVYAGVGYQNGLSSGMFRSTDGGATFTMLGFLPVASLALEAPTGMLYAATGGDVFRSADGGATWTPASPLPSGSAAVVLSGGALWAGTLGRTSPMPTQAGSVFRSLDGGTTWEERASGVPHVPGAGTSIATFAVHPTSQTVWMGMQHFGVFRNDDTVHWRHANNGFSQLRVQRLTIDATAPATLWATTSRGLYRSSDRGASWAPAVDGFGDLVASPIALDPFDPQRLFAASIDTGNVFLGEGVFRSDDAGTSWTANNAGLNNTHIDVGSIAFDPVNQGTIYLGHLVLGLSKSTDGGANWTTIQPASFSASSLLIDPNTPTTLYASGTAFGVSKSIDAGATWTTANTGLPSTSVFASALDPNDPLRLYALGLSASPLATTADGAASWTPVASVPIVPQSIAVDAATSTVFVGGTGVYGAAAGGASWTPVGDDAPPGAVSALAVDPAAALLFAGTTGVTLGDVAWVQLAPCTTDAACDDGNPCTTDSCDVPTGTCGYVGLADDTTCTTSEGCPDGVCAAGACRPRPCGTCDGAVDTDADGSSDTCDPSEGALAIRSAKVVVHPTKAATNVEGTILPGTLPSVFAPAGVLVLRVTSGGGAVAAGSWQPADCRVRAPGRFTCTSTDRKAKLKVNTSSKAPTTPKFAVKLRGLTITSLPAAPLAVELIEPAPSIERTGTIAACTVRGAALTCRQ